MSFVMLNNNVPVSMRLEYYNVCLLCKVVWKTKFGAMAVLADNIMASGGGPGTMGRINLLKYGRSGTLNGSPTSGPASPSLAMLPTSRDDDSIWSSPLHKAVKG